METSEEGIRRSSTSSAGTSVDKWIDLGNMDVRAPSPTRSPQQLAETRAAEENVEMVDLGSSAAAAAMAAAAEEIDLFDDEGGGDGGMEGEHDEGEAAAASSSPPPMSPRELPVVGAAVFVRSPRRGSWHDARVIETDVDEGGLGLRVRIHFNGYKKTPANIRWLPLHSSDLQFRKPKTPSPPARHRTRRRTRQGMRSQMVRRRWRRVRRRRRRRRRCLKACRRL